MDETWLDAWNEGATDKGDDWIVREVLQCWADQEGCDPDDLDEHVHKSAELIAERYRNMTDEEVQRRAEELEAMEAEFDEPLSQTDPTKSDNNGEEQTDG